LHIRGGNEQINGRNRGDDQKLVPRIRTLRLQHLRWFLKLEQVRIITWRPLREFGDRWSAAAPALRQWYALAAGASWHRFADVKATFGQTDQVKVGSGQTVCVFDIGGNKFRLVAFVSYPKGKIYVLRVLTHKEYDRGNQQWKDEL
jgi:mRNA interferase HigB